jgi:Protein of unknown function (DUF2786)
MQQATDAVLARIRQLLAKAESTTFEAEALAFTAKAQELMTRHAIDSALVHDTEDDRHDGPITRTVHIDAPYSSAKARLLQTVAQAGRCRAVYYEARSCSAVAGFPDDVAAVELLFTSLLVQAQGALAEAARRAPAGTSPRSRGFRSAFLRGFDHRIDQRLREINDAFYASVVAERGDAFLPALRSREQEVEDYYSETFRVILKPVRSGHDPAGWASGTLAADTAHLTSGVVRRKSA